MDTDQVIQQAEAKLDDTAPVKDDKGAPDDKTTPPKDDKGTPPVKETPKEEPKTEPAPDGGEEEEGFVADELEPDDEDNDVDEEPEAPEPSNLSPQQQYIYENLPTIQVKGQVGEKGQTRTFNVKTAQELPDNFLFATDRDRAIFTQDLADQSARATALLNQYTNDQQKAQYEQFEAKENADIQSDMADLQREGLLPRFKLQPNDPKFDSDPAVVEAQKVLDFMNKKNADYAAANKLFRLSYRDAYDIYQGQNKSPDQDNEDKARKDVTRRLAGSTGASPSDTTKPRVRSGMTVDQILEMHENDF